MSILSNKDHDPCEDFYEYSCGGWSQKKDSGYSLVNKVAIQNLMILKTQLASNTTYPEITETEMKAKLFYSSCLDKQEKIEELGFFNRKWKYY